MKIGEYNAIKAKAQLIGADYSEFDILDGGHCLMIKQGNELLAIIDEFAESLDYVNNWPILLYTAEKFRFSKIVKLVGGENLKRLNFAFNSLRADTIDISGVNCKNLKDVSQMFSYTVAKNIIFGDFDTSQVSNFSRMFDQAIIDNIDLSTLDIRSGKDFSSMFRCTECKNLKLSCFDGYAGFLNKRKINCDNMFDLCKIDKVETTSLYIMQKYKSECRRHKQ